MRLILLLSCFQRHVNRRATSSSVCITSERQWRLFSDSLASEGLVIEPWEQQRLQKLWDKAVVGATAFGRREKPSLSLSEVHACVDDMYTDKCSAEARQNVADAKESALGLAALLDAWNVHTFTRVQTKQALEIIYRLQDRHRRAVIRLDQEQQRQREAFITESVLRLIASRQKDKNIHTETSGFDTGCTGLGGSSPRLWQDTNTGLVEHMVAKARVKTIRYPGIGNRVVSRGEAGVDFHGGILQEDDLWELSQGLAGTNGVCCRRGYAKRSSGNDEFPVTVVVMPKVGLRYAVRERLWRAFLAHRQLATGGCVMHSLGFADQDSEETLFYYEHIRARSVSVVLRGRQLAEGDLLFRHWSRCALVCLAQICEQSTFKMEQLVTSANLMVAGQGTILRLAGIRWGPELHGPDTAAAAAENSALEREAQLCTEFADILEELLGFAEQVKSRVAGELDKESAVPSPILANILACLRLPPKSREEITLKTLKSHQYFAPLGADDLQGRLQSDWKELLRQDTTGQA